MSSSNDFVIPNSVASTADFLSLIQEVRVFEQWITSQSTRSALKIKKPTHIEEPVLSDYTKEALRSWQQDHILSGQSLQQLARLLEQQKATSKTITVTLAAPATTAVKARIVAWCRQSLHPRLLVNFEFDRSLLGGAVVRSGSKMHDWSFRTQLVASRNAFPEVLRRV